MNTENLTIYDKEAPALQRLEIIKSASGFQFTEGPLWHPNGYLLFSDIPANKIYQLDASGNVNVFLDKSGFSGEDHSMLSEMIGSNGLALDSQRHLVICQHGNHAIAGMAPDKTMHILTDRFDNRPFNSPNDLVIASDGSIYFTDPPYGLKEQVLHPHQFQTGAGIYRYYRGETRLLSTDLRYPNGICLAPREKCLYVGSNHPDEPFIWKYTLKDGRIQNQSVLIEHNADGIKTDNRGRIFMATDEGILIVSPAGKRLALIRLPEIPSNMAWANKNYSELYVTARSSVYRVNNID